jgi:hypothetical protein
MTRTRWISQVLSKTKARGFLLFRVRPDPALGSGLDYLSLEEALALQGVLSSAIDFVRGGMGSDPEVSPPPVQVTFRVSSTHLDRSQIAEAIEAMIRAGLVTCQFCDRPAETCRLNSSGGWEWLCADHSRRSGLAAWGPDAGVREGFDTVSIPVLPGKALPWLLALSPEQRGAITVEFYAEGEDILWTRL